MLKRKQKNGSNILSRVQFILEKDEKPLSNVDVRTPIEHLENIRAVLTPY